MWWSKERIRWYEKAAGETEFHKALVTLLIPYLNKNDEIAELGCGLGYITNELRVRGFNVKGYDIDTAAIGEAKTMFGQNYFVNDCISNIPISDILLAVFFGHFTDNEFLHRALNSTKQLIIISNLHAMYKTKQGSALENTLKEEKLAYKISYHSLPFHQRLESKEDALAFIKSYYPNDIETVLNELKRDGNSYLLENNKKFTITVIKGRKKI